MVHHFGSAITCNVGIVIPLVPYLVLKMGKRCASKTPLRGLQLTDEG